MDRQNTKRKGSYAESWHLQFDINHMMKSNNPDSKLRNLTPAIRINIWRHGVNVYTSDESLVPYINKIREKEKDYGIPSFSVLEPITPDSGEYGMVVGKGDL